MTPAQQRVLADEGGPVFAGGSFQLVIASLRNVQAIMQRGFRAGGGVPFAELGPEVSEAIHRVHVPTFSHTLINEWFAQVPGLLDHLRSGLTVVDVGCGYGESTVRLASAFTDSHFVGVEPDPTSVERARARAAECGLTNVRFVPQTIAAYAADGRAGRADVVFAYDTVHDMVDPVGGLRAMAACLRASAAVAASAAPFREPCIIWSEPRGSSNAAENRNVRGKMRAAISPLHCLTVSLAQGGRGLGTLIGQDGARQLAAEAGLRFDVLPIENDAQFFYCLRRAVHDAHP